MTEPFSIYAVSVTWIRKDIIGHVQPSVKHLDVEEIPEQNIWVLDIAAYQRMNGKPLQIAIKSKEKCRIRQNTETIDMYQFEDQNGEIWNIEKGDWNDEYKCHFFPSFNHPGGQMCLHVGSCQILVRIYYDAYEPDEMDMLLDEVRDTCWDMIREDSSYVKSHRYTDEVGVDKGLVDSLTGFAASVRTLMSALNFELRESSSLQPIERLHPNARSFIELCVKGEQKLITGRAHISSYNTRENRQIAMMVNRAYQLVFHLSSQAKRIGRGIGRELVTVESRKSELKSKLDLGVVRLDPEQIRANITDLRARQNVYERDIGRDTTLHIRVSKPMAGYAHSYNIYVKPKSNPNSKDEWGILDMKGCPDISLCPNTDYILSGVYEVYTPAGKTYNVYRASAMSRIVTPIDYDGHILKLETALQSNYELPMKDQSKQEFEKHIQSLAGRIVMLKSRSDAYVDLTTSLVNLSEQLSNIKRKLQELGVAADTYLYPTITFVKNQRYANVMSFYQEVSRHTGIDDDVYEKLMTLDEWGIQDWPNVFERWCILRIVSVLVNEFSFVSEEPVGQWVINNITGRSPYNKVISFAHPDEPYLKIVLRYQWETSQWGVNKVEEQVEINRRPDFILEFSWCDRLVRLVIDAKSCAFKVKPVSEVREGNMTLDATIVKEKKGKNATEYLTDCVRDLVKKYKKACVGDPDFPVNNLVYALHSAHDCVDRPLSGLSWQDSTTYGGSISFPEWQSDNPNHRVGAVCIRPDNSDDLARLIGMIFQYFLRVDNKSEMRETHECNDSEQEASLVPRIQPFFICPFCAHIVRNESEDTSDPNIRSLFTGAHYQKYWVTCPQCKHFFVATHCVQCHIALWKNGLIGNYHDISPLDPTNNKCPACGSFYVSTKKT
ncbi:MAG: hypothetical protein ACYC1M_14525 [Armatimonadota bacterium]